VERSRRDVAVVFCIKVIASDTLKHRRVDCALHVDTAKYAVWWRRPADVSEGSIEARLPRRIEGSLPNGSTRITHLHLTPHYTCKVFCKTDLVLPTIHAAESGRPFNDAAKGQCGLVIAVINPVFFLRRPAPIAECPACRCTCVRDVAIVRGVKVITCNAQCAALHKDAAIQAPCIRLCQK